MPEHRSLSLSLSLSLFETAVAAAETHVEDGHKLSPRELQARFLCVVHEGAHVFETALR